MATMRTLNGYGFNATEFNGKTASDYLLKTDTAADSAKLGGKAPEYYLSPRNLLDNSDFRNPVNQRGITTFSETSGYWLDRWVETRCSIDLTANTASVAEGTENNGYFYQRMPRMDEGKELTFAIKIGGDLFVASGNIQEGSASTAPLLLETAWGGLKIYSVNDLSVAMVYINAGNTISLPVWAALYEGSYTADTLPPYVPKGYAAELAECQRYYYQSFPGSSAKGWDGMIVCEAIKTDRATNVFFPQTMRIEKPTVTLYSPFTGNAGKASEYVSDTEVDVGAIYRSRYTFILNSAASAFETGKHYCIHYTVSADL